MRKTFTSQLARRRPRASRCCSASAPAPGTTRTPSSSCTAARAPARSSSRRRCASRATAIREPHRVLEYDSSAIATILPAVLAALDALIAELQAETGAAQVDLIGHSLGTTVSHNFLATPERAANVAHYVNIDGRTAAAPPGGVPTLALWAGAVNRPVPPADRRARPTSRSRTRSTCRWRRPRSRSSRCTASSAAGRRSRRTSCPSSGRGSPGA